MSPTVLFGNTPEFSALGGVDLTSDRIVGVVVVSVPSARSLVLLFIPLVFLSALLFVS
jgi:hypothetical protein